jgi:hypothetical protein
LVRGCAALAAVLAVLVSAPAASNADISWGNPLQGSPTVTKEAPVDSVYWARTFADGTSAAAPTAGAVKSVTIRGYWTGTGEHRIAFQVLRPQPDGSLLVVETSQLFEVSGTPGTYVFMPTGMTVQPGDFLGLAIIGGGFVIATSEPGASTNDFTGAGQDMNGSVLRPSTVEKDVALLLQVDLVPSSPGGSSGGNPPPPKKGDKALTTPCKCQKISVKLDGTLLNKRRLRASRRDFGVDLTWRMTCSQGKGGCTAVLGFQPPVILAGTLPAVPGLKLSIRRRTFVCKSACLTSTTGRLEVNVSSRGQLKKLFGRTLSLTVTTSCGGASSRSQVRVLIDGAGRIHAAH